MKVKLIPYDSYWHKAFEEESKPIKDILKGLLIDIYHIGSTAVEGYGGVWHNKAPLF